MDASTSKADRIILGRSEAIRRLCCEIETLARGPLRSVLVVGETGTGKDLVPRALAACSPRRSDHVEVFNCPAVPADHLESELFGTTRGAYPGSVDRAGAAQRAQGGVLFLDEIAAMPLVHQGKILRLLEDGEARRLGATRSYQTDAVVVAATNQDLREAAARRAFREDLYYRLVQDGVLAVPPLRERPEDVELLARVFLAEVDETATFAESGLCALRNYDWPGNVRQLRAVVRNAARLAGPRQPVAGRHVHEALGRIEGATSTGLIKPTAEPTAAPPGPPGRVAFYAAPPPRQREMLIEALRTAGGNQTEAGMALGLHRSRHNGNGVPDLRARKLAHRKFRYWWSRRVEGPEASAGAGEVRRSPSPEGTLRRPGTGS